MSVFPEHSQAVSWEKAFLIALFAWRTEGWAVSTGQERELPVYFWNTAGCVSKDTQNKERSTKHDLLKKKNPGIGPSLGLAKQDAVWECVFCVAMGGGSWAYVHDYQFSKERTVLKPYSLK